MDDQRSTSFEVQGMSCGSCVRHVTAALKEIEGVNQVEVKLREGQVVVWHDATRVAPKQVIRALAEVGYPADLSRTDRSEA